MQEDYGYLKFNCKFPIENKSITIQLPLDVEFKLNVLAYKKGISSEQLAKVIIEEYIKNNHKNKSIEKLFDK